MSRDPRAIDRTQPPDYRWHGLRAGLEVAVVTLMVGFGVTFVDSDYVAGTILVLGSMAVTVVLFMGVNALVREWIAYATTSTS
jgi:hypothetical protein